MNTLAEKGLRWKAVIAYLKTGRFARIAGKR